MDIEFEWDENKRRTNIRKHGFDFEGAAEVFEGETVTTEDTRYEYGETRFLTFGMWKGRVVVIAHTESEHSIRIISLRKATKHEEKQYFQALGYELGAD